MATDTTGIDDLFTALAAFDWGRDASALAALDARVVAADPAERADLERRLAGLLAGDASRAAKDYACRRLCLVGSAASVPALAPLLRDRGMSHMARFALERIEAPEAGRALLDALGEVEGDLQIGVISSLAARREAAAVPALAALIAGEPASAVAAAAALGRIGTPQAAAVLAGQSPAEGVADAVFDARITVAETLLAAGDRAAAAAAFRSLLTTVRDQPATRRDRAARCAARAGLIDSLDDT
jgi:hypothetical protein